jgi:hypothetical protein
LNRYSRGNGTGGLIAEDRDDEIDRERYHHFNG